jgi:hypothetical protein
MVTALEANVDVPKMETVIERLLQIATYSTEKYVWNPFLEREPLFEEREIFGKVWDVLWKTCFANHKRATQLKEEMTKLGEETEVDCSLYKVW